MYKKKGVSMMVSYALLIIIAIGLAAIVYPFLKARLPVDQVECPADLSVSIEEATCDRAANLVYVTLFNRGLFNVTGVYVRFAESSAKVRPQINPGREIYLKGADTSPLAPGQSTPILSYPPKIDLSDYSSDTSFTLEIQPAIFKESVLVPCSNKIITQTISCGSTATDWQEDDTEDQFGCEGDWLSGTGCINIHDQDWNTYETAATDKEAVYYANYTIVSGALFADSDQQGDSNWTVKVADTNLSFAALLVACSKSDNKLQFKIYIDRRPATFEGKYLQLMCFGESAQDWIALDTIHQTDAEALYVYEEKMNWQLRA